MEQLHYHTSKSLTYKNVNQTTKRSTYNIDPNGEIEQFVFTKDGREKTLYLEEVSLEGSVIHHITDSRHGLYLQLRSRCPDISITYSTKKEMEIETGLYPLA